MTSKPTDPLRRFPSSEPRRAFFDATIFKVFKNPLAGVLKSRASGAA